MRVIRASFPETEQLCVKTFQRLPKYSLLAIIRDKHLFGKQIQFNKHRESNPNYGAYFFSRIFLRTVNLVSATSRQFSVAVAPL
jgi:hypothetical protein